MPVGDGFIIGVRPNGPQILWEIIAAAATSLLIHSIRIEFLPQVTSGVAQDQRAAIAIQTITTTGTGGSAITPSPEHPRNTGRRGDDFQRSRNHSRDVGG